MPFSPQVDEPLPEFVGCETDVVAGSVFGGLQGIDEVLGLRHAADRSKPDALRNSAELTRVSRAAPLPFSVIALPVRGIDRNFRRHGRLQNARVAADGSQGLRSRSSFRDKGGPPPRCEATLRRGILRLHS